MRNSIASNTEKIIIVWEFRVMKSLLSGSIFVSVV
jgi:hypothetical protein